MTKGSVSSKELRFAANGLDQRVLEWSGVEQRAGTAILIHGFMDAAGTWDRVAPTLADRGYRVLAPDMRGFGGAGRAPRGGYYHFSDYVADLAEIIATLSPREPVTLVGHSMGGTIVTYYAGAFPENVTRLALLEGLGPPDNPWEVGPTRMRRWIEDLRKSQSAEQAPFSREVARSRLIGSHPRVPPKILESRLQHLVKDAGGDRVMWCFDPLHRTTAPVPFFAKLFIEFAKLVTCPVLFVSGGSNGFHVPDEDERLAAFANVRRATLEDAGHMMHWSQPEALADVLSSFLS